MSRIEDVVCQKIQLRAAIGKEKYGTTMRRVDLTELQWLTHAQEEAMDLAIYLQKLIEEKLRDEIIGNKNVSPCVAHDIVSEEEIADEAYAEFMLAKSESRKAEERMKHIGQNGNDGTHY